MPGLPRQELSKLIRILWCYHPTPPSVQSPSSPTLTGILTREGDSKGSGHPSLQTNEGLSMSLLPALLPPFLRAQHCQQFPDCIPHTTCWLSSSPCGVPASFDSSERAALTWDTLPVLLKYKVLFLKGH